MTVTLLQQAAVAIAAALGVVAVVVGQRRRRRARLAAWRRFVVAHPSSSTAPRGTPGSRRAAVGGIAPVSVPSHPPTPGYPLIVHADSGRVCLHRGDCPRDDHQELR